VGWGPERGKGLKKALVYPKTHERGELVENTLDLGTICPLKKIPLMPHSLGTEVMEVEHHQRTGTAARRSHEHKKLKN
jgi:hypothetical protein